MELTKIVIKNYKAIKSPVEISFNKDMPTVLIGKNGCGKTTILEALYRIAEANRKGAYGFEKGDILYNVQIQLSKEDLEAVLPILKYDKEKCKIVAYGGNENLQMDRIESSYIVPSFKKEIADIGKLADQLEQAVAVYQMQIEKITREDGNESPIQSFDWQYADGRLTNYYSIHSNAKYFMENIRKFLDALHDNFTDRENEYIFQGSSHVGISYLYSGPIAFHLDYVEPDLSAFVKKHIIIDRDAIQKEIDQINTETKESCDLINTLIGEIRERTIRIHDGFMKEEDRQAEKDARYSRLLMRVKEVIGRKCLFLRNENNDLLFKRQRLDGSLYYERNDHANSILQTYLRYVYSGEDKEKLLQSPSKDFVLPEQATKDFEEFLNANRPSFDIGMYESISVESDKDGHLSIYLNENTGERVNLNETSAGRRWYFTYYFMKNLLDEGDIFIIDEPAVALHPSAQVEVRDELIELVKRGIKVVYSTHSPYLVPQDWRCVKFVSMEDEVKVSAFEMETEEFTNFRASSSFDIFEYGIQIDYYCNSKYKHMMAKNIVQKLINKYSTSAAAAREMGVTSKTIENWQKSKPADGNSSKKSISFENICKAANLLETDPLTLMKETEG
jgi:predicted ATPase